MKLSVISEQGKEAILDILGGGDVCGEECVGSDQADRAYSAIALTEVRGAEIARDKMLGILREQTSARTFSLPTFSRGANKFRNVSRTPF